MQETYENVHSVSHSKVSLTFWCACHPCLIKISVCPHTFFRSLTLDNVVGVWGIAQSTNCPALISACLPLLPTDIPRLLKLKLNSEQLKDVLRLPSIKNLGGEHQMRLVASWTESEAVAATQITPIDHLDSLLPLVDLQTFTDDTFINFMGEHHAMLANHQYR